jgi:NADH-quinone oxidoreductase subunit M
MLLVLPLGGLLVAPLVGSAARIVGMAVMLAVLARTVTLVIGFDPAATPPSVRLGGLPAIGVGLDFALDGFNVYLVLLTALLFPVVLACAWNGPEGRSRLYVACLLALQAGLFATFLAQDLVVLFVAWEAVLIPMVLLILVFGGAERRRAAMTFFLYTMAGSVLFLAAVILLGVQGVRATGQWSFGLEALGALKLPVEVQAFVFVAIALACAIKSPLVPFHSWLPLAYRQASPSGTALMAGVMSKMGAFGFARLAIPLCPDVAPQLAGVMVALAVTSILYGAVLALRQRDYKLLVAYASLSHMGYVVLGLFSFEPAAVHGAMVQMLSHGVTVAGLFLLLGLLEARRGGDWLRTTALARRAPRFAVVLMLFLLASLALPLTSGFTAEFLVLLGAFTRGFAVWQAQQGAGLLVAAVLASLGVVLGASYLLRLARTLVFGPVRAKSALADLRRGEIVALASLLVVILWLGVWPAPFLAKVDDAVARIAQPAAGGVVVTLPGAAHAR